MPRGGARVRAADGKLNVVGVRVVMRRHALTLTQDQVCGQIAAVTTGKWTPGWQDMSRIENGSRLVSDVEVLVLAEVLACEACWLLSGKS
jgi:hypothetical protein